MTTNLGGAMNTENITDGQLAAWCGEAYNLGRDAGIAAASWCYDGNSDPAERARVLAMLRDGDPEAFDYLPREPNLSGEWADEATPASVCEAILPDTSTDGETTGEWFDRTVSADLCDALCDAWERGASDAFFLECERLLIAFCED